MKKYILLLSFIVTLCTSVYSHTGYPDTVICPICNDTVVFHLTMSMTSFDGYLDFQKRGAIGYYYEEMINSCHSCYFSGYVSDFDTTYSKSYIDSIKTVTSKHKGKTIDNPLECEIAAEIKTLTDSSFDHISNIYLIASYFLRTDSLQIERRKELQLKTVKYLEKALANDEYAKDLIATINYLIGEMYRRTSNFDKAIYHYDLAIKDKKRQDWVKDIAIKQKELAIKEDDNNDI